MERRAAHAGALRFAANGKGHPHGGTAGGWFSPGGCGLCLAARARAAHGGNHFWKPGNPNRRPATEIDLGEWEGRLQAELDIDDAEQHSNFWKSPHRFAPQTGETFECVHRRAAACLHDLAARHDGESIALVSHTTVIRSMLFSIEERPLADFWNPPAVYPASVSEVHVEDGQFKIARFGDIAHYGPDSRPSGAY